MRTSSLSINLTCRLLVEGAGHRSRIFFFHESLLGHFTEMLTCYDAVEYHAHSSIWKVRVQVNARWVILFVYNSDRSTMHFEIKKYFWFKSFS